MGPGTNRSMRHHDVIYNFKPFCGEVPGNYGADFLGSLVRLQFYSRCYRPEAVTVTDIYPELNEEYFEWIDLLEAVVAAKSSFTMIDLGAGFGRWSVRAARAVRQYHGNLPFHLTAVEAEPQVFQWMHLHFTDNGVNPADHRLIHAAVSEAPGPVQFNIGGPRGGPFDLKPNEWYGQFLTQDHDLARESLEDGEYCGFKVNLHESQWRSISIPSVSLKGILKDLDRVDLVDMDIEGQELPAISSAINELDAKVKRVHIGTHGREIEAELRRLFTERGWLCQADYTIGGAHETPYGTFSFGNGAQSWVNRKF